MKYKIEYMKHAEVDLENIFDYVLDGNFTSARNYRIKISRGIEDLKDNPFSGALNRIPRYAKLGFRRLIIGKHIVHYVPNTKKEIITVFRVLHHKMNQEKRLLDAVKK